jgi:DHA1 family bicyclomycin/chloramphenicol resistance-like MFS transporter
MVIPKLSFEAKLIFILSIIVAFGPMSIDMYLPAFTSIATDFHVDIAQVQYTLASFNIGLAMGQLFYGPLSDQFGRKRVLLGGMVIYFLATIGCALATSIDQMIYLRFLQAIGGCAGMVTSRAVVRDRFSGNEAAKVFSTMMLIMGVAPIVAPTIGGLALLHFDWRSIFWLLAIFSATAILAVSVFLPETLSQEKCNSNAIRRSLSTYRSILKDRVFMGYGLAAGMLQGAMFAYITSSSFVYINLFGFSEQQYGLMFGGNALGFIATTQLNHIFLKRMDYNTLLLRGILFNVTCAMLLTLGAISNIFSPYGVLVPLFFMIASLGVIFPNASAGALMNQSTHAGSASALLGTVMFTCGGIAAFMVGLFADGTILPMTLTIFTCAVLGLILSKWLKKNLMASTLK